MSAPRNRLPLTACSRRRARGVGLIETLVGILIGMIVILVVYNILSVAEGYRRTTVGASDAQINGLLSQLVASRDIGNGGAGITVSNEDLINCTRNDAGLNVRTMPVTQLDAAVRPIPLLITDGGNAWTSDSFISMWGGASHVMWPVDFTSTALPGAAITVQSPNGFTVPPPAPGPGAYWAVVMANDASGTCKMVRLTAATVADAQGRVTVTQDPLTATTATYPVGPPARMLNLGPTGMATRVQYDVVGGVLRTTDLLVVPPTAPTPVPFAQNIVLMKVQYGIDTDPIPDGLVNCWTAADNLGACDGNDYSADGVRAMPLANLNRILAVRIGVVVRSDEPDLRLLTDPTNTNLQNESAGILKATRPQPYLFNCSTNNAACQGRIKVPMGNGGGASTCGATSVICDYWRYRTYETVVPLRNAIFSATLP